MCLNYPRTHSIWLEARSGDPPYSLALISSYGIFIFWIQTLSINLILWWLFFPDQVLCALVWFCLDESIIFQLFEYIYPFWFLNTLILNNKFVIARLAVPNFQGSVSFHLREGAFNLVYFLAHQLHLQLNRTTNLMRNAWAESLKLISTFARVKKSILKQWCWLESNWRIRLSVSVLLVFNLFVWLWGERVDLSVTSVVKIQFKVNKPISRFMSAGNLSQQSLFILLTCFRHFFLNYGIRFL